MYTSTLVRLGAVAVASIYSVYAAPKDSEMKKEQLMQWWPQPGKDYMGASHVGKWTHAPNYVFPRQNLAEVPGFSDLPNPDPLGSMRPPKPLRVEATPPFRMSEVRGNCTIPTGSNFDTSGARIYGAHIWLANLLYSEFIPWPIDLWVPAGRAIPHPSEPNSLLFPFVLPIYDHLSDPDHPLFWQPWAAGPGGSVHQALTGLNPDGVKQEWMDIASRSWHSSSPFIHSWASFGAAEWTVFCNAFVMDQATGSMRVGTYKALDDMELDLAAATASPAGKYVPALDGIDGAGRSRWDEGYTGAWLHGGQGSQLTPGAANAITGRWGKHVTIGPEYNYKQECCWRGYTGPGAVMRNIWERNGSNMTWDDCCWFALPAHTHDPLFPLNNQPVTDASKFAAVWNETADKVDIGYWGYRRTQSPKAKRRHTAHTCADKMGHVYANLWTWYGDTGHLSRVENRLTSTQQLTATPVWNIFLHPHTVETLKLSFEPSPLAGGIMQDTVSARMEPRPVCCDYSIVNEYMPTTITLAAPSRHRGLGETPFPNEYRWYLEEWVLEWRYPDNSDGRVRNLTDARMLADLGPDHDPQCASMRATGMAQVRPTMFSTTSDGFVPHTWAMQMFRIFTHGWNTFKSLEPMVADNLRYNWTHDETPVALRGPSGEKCCELRANDAPPGVRQSFMVRLTSQLTPYTNFTFAPIGNEIFHANIGRFGLFPGAVPFWEPNSRPYNRTHGRPAFNPPELQRYTDGRVGNGSTVWNALQFVTPKRSQVGPRKLVPLQVHPSFSVDAFKAAFWQGSSGMQGLNALERATRAAHWGWSVSDPALDAYAGAPYTLRMADLKPWNHFEDTLETRSFYGTPYATPYDDLKFTFEPYTFPWTQASITGGWDRMKMALTGEEPLDSVARSWELKNADPSTLDYRMYGWINPVQFAAAKVEGGWSNASFTFAPTSHDKLFVVNVTVWDTGFSPSQLAALGYSSYDQSVFAGPAGTTFQFFIAPQPCPNCPAGQFPLASCRGKGMPTVCAACNSTCPVGQYISKPCAGTAYTGGDRQCASCLSTCPRGQRLSHTCDGAGSLPNTCLVCSTCPAGSYASGGCTGVSGGTTDTVCTPCPATPAVVGNGTIFVPAGCPTSVQVYSGNVVINNIQNTNIQGSNVTAPAPSPGATQTVIQYRSCTQCTDGLDYVTVPCSPSADTTCSACSPTCGTGTYQSRACTKDHDRQCTACTTACASGTYLSSPCTATTNSVCSVCTSVCPAGSYRTAPCTATADMQCTQCDCSSVGSASCDATSGTCTCKAGFTDARCDECVPGVWGHACAEQCTCAGPGSTSTSCANRDGRCTCKAGWAGFYCDTCAAGRYGSSCAGTCACGAHGLCHDGLSGDGSCLCHAGWQGPTCSSPIDTSTAAIFKGVDIPGSTAREGQLFTLAVPSSAFIFYGSGGVQTGLNPSAANVSMVGPAWLQLQETTGTPSGWSLAGTPSRSDVTASSGVSIVLTARREGGQEASTAITLLVQHTNRAPAFTTLPIQPASVRVGSRWSVSLTWSVDVTDEDAASMGDAVSVAWSNLPAWAAVQPLAVDGNGRKVWSVKGSPPADAAGTSTTVTITLTDSAGATATTTTTVTVAGAGAAAVLAFAGVPAVHVAQGQALSYVLPASAFTIDASQPGAPITSYSSASVAPVTTPPTRQRLLAQVGGVVEKQGKGSSGVRSLSTLVTAPHAALSTHGARVLHGAVEQVKAELDAEVEAAVAARAGERKQRRLAQWKEKEEARNMDVKRRLAAQKQQQQQQQQQQQEVETSVDVHRELQAEDGQLDSGVILANEADPNWSYAFGDMERTRQKEDWEAEFKDRMSMAPTPARIAAHAEVRVLSAIGSCAWLSVAKSGDSPSRPLLWGTPGPLDKDAVCEVTVTATNEAGFNVSGKVSVVVDAVNYGPTSLVPSMPALARPALQYFARTWSMKAFFADQDAVGAISSRDILSYSVHELGSSSPSSLPPFLHFTCTGSVAGTISESCALTGNASVAQMGSYGLQVVATDSAGATASIPFMLHIGAPSVFTLRTSPWSACTRTCGAGITYRTHACVDYRGMPVDAANCAQLMAAQGLNSSVETSACNTSPCGAAVWQAGPWAPCSASCTTLPPGYTSASLVILPTTTRTVTCVSANGVDTLADSACDAGSKPALSRTCNSQACPPSSGAPPVQAPAGCAGIVDPAGVCCDQPSPSGYCCLASDAQARIDECGVWDGLNACPLASSPLTLASQGLATRICGAGFTVQDSLAVTSVRADLLSAIAFSLGVPESAVVVGTFTCLPPPTTASAAHTGSSPQAGRRLAAVLLHPAQSSGRRLSQTGAGAVSTTLSVSTGGLSSVEVGTALRERLPVRFQAITGLAVAVEAFQPERDPVCGNGVCEIGESCGDSSCDESQTCTSDCGQVTAATCPVDAIGRPCSGQGACLLSTGVCACKLGYTGASCTECSAGFAPSVSGSTRQCITVREAAVEAQVLPTIPEVGFLDRPGFGAVASLGAVVAVAAAFFVLRKVKSAWADRKASSVPPYESVPGGNRQSMPAGRGPSKSKQPTLGASTDMGDGHFSSINPLAAMHGHEGGAAAMPQPYHGPTTTTSAYSSAVAQGSMAAFTLRVSSASRMEVGADALSPAASLSRRSKGEGAGDSAEASMGGAHAESQRAGSKAAFGPHRSALDDQLTNKPKNK